jgi:dipeptidyl aminopeptidase/acylaminoacyl peptidase
MKKYLILLLIISGIYGQLAASEKIVISHWLVTESQQIKMPAFYDQPNTRGETFVAENLLRFDHINVKSHSPEFGIPFTNTIAWGESFSDSNGYVFLHEKTDSNDPQIAYLAAYIWADRWMNTTLEIKSPHMLRVWLDGEEIGTKNSTESQENTIGMVNKDLKLERGNHLLLIKTVKPANAPLDWKVMANLQIKEPYALSDIRVSLSPSNRKNIKHIMDGEKTNNIQLSADGKYYLIQKRRSLPPTNQSETWTEIRRMSDHSLVQSFRHARITQAQWLPRTNRMSYVNTRDKKSTLFVYDPEKGSNLSLVEDKEELSSYKWAPDESFVIYSIREEGSRTDTDLRRVHGMQDRLPEFRHRNFLYRYDVASKLDTRLTYGNLTTSLHDISPDSKKIVFSTTGPVYTSRSFSQQHLFMMDLATLQADTILFEQPRSIQVSFSPDGKFLLATGGPSAFDGKGENVQDGATVNNYDTQAFIYDLQTRQVNAFTRDFNPSVNSVHWHRGDNHIYIETTDEDFRRVYRYDVRRQRINPIDMGFDYVTSLSFADQSHTAVFRASQTNAHPKYYILNLKNMRYTLLDDSEGETYRHVEFGEVMNWDFTASSGVHVKGRVYYPPDFDPETKYPVIVYYYAGTTPVGRTFGGRYPFNLWAGNGYLVYVLQPSGAIGFGQQFSAAHVNNWGFTVADEIIEGTQKFLEAHPFANPDKIGCAGASYGGFMTMLLMTRTDMFTAAISHAGISSISSYWGEGFWGYAYSSEASAESFPWNNKDLYVGQSPLFHADKINTPLLLITGDSDTNVPPGESIQMYTALKILDRPVELILVKGEDHHIVTYNKRIKWHNSIMAWWDKHLKDQPQWWEDQFPEKNY